MANFNNLVEANNLIDIGYVGNHFTWHNRWGDKVYMKQRLDRALVSRDWLDMYEQAWPQVIKTTTSNHNMLMLYFKDKHATRRQFFFERTWLMCVTCEEVLNKA